MRFLRYITVVSMAVGCAAYAQVNTINSAKVTPRFFNDIPGAVLTTVNNYPSLISFSEVGVSAATGFANRDIWQTAQNSVSEIFLPG